MLNSVLIIQPLPFQPRMLWIRGLQEVSSRQVQQKACWWISLPTLITAWERQTAGRERLTWLLKVTRFKGLRLRDTGRVEHWKEICWIYGDTNKKIRLGLRFVFAKGEPTTNFGTLFLPMLCKKLPSWVLFLFPVSCKIWKHFLIDGKPLKSFAPWCCLTCC